MIVKGWYTCPTCHKNLLRVPRDAVLFGTPVYCRKCRVEWFPTIYLGRELGDDEPFPMKEQDPPHRCGQE